MIVPITAGAALSPSVVFLLVPVSTFSAGGEAGGAEGTGGGASGKGEAAAGGEGDGGGGLGGDETDAGGGGGGGVAVVVSPSPLGGSGGGGDGDGGGGLGGADGGGIGGKMGCCTSTDRALSSRLRPADTDERTCSVDKLPCSRAFASSAPPSLVTDSSTLTLLRVLLVTFTPLPSSCGMSVISAVVLPSLSERENVATVPPLCSARRRLETSVQLG